MSKYEEHLKLTDDAIDALVNVYKENISHLEVLREHIKDMNEDQLKDFITPFSTIMLQKMSEDAKNSGVPILAAIYTVKDIKEGKCDM